MAGINGITGGISAITGGYSSTQAATLNNEVTKFQSLVDEVQRSNTAQSGQENTQTGESIAFVKNTLTLSQEGRLNGDYTSGFAGTFSQESDKHALPVGAAANSAIQSSGMQTIDKTDVLYEKSLELESYFVKIMLSSMRNTLTGTSLSGEEKSYAQSMYEDMMYDELAVVMTKNAGFGLADQIYLQLKA
ncbi:MAG: rod-binding protein [Spirochaetales bacterium]